MGGGGEGGRPNSWREKEDNGTQVFVNASSKCTHKRLPELRAHQNQISVLINVHSKGSYRQSSSKSTVCKQYMYTQKTLRAHQNQISVLINVNTKGSNRQISSKSAVCKQEMYTYKRHPSSELIKIICLQAISVHTRCSPRRSSSKSTVCKQQMNTQQAPLLRAYRNHLSSSNTCTHKMLPSSELMKIICLQAINVHTRCSPRRSSSKSTVCK